LCLEPSNFLQANKSEGQPYGGSATSGPTALATAPTGDGRVRPRHNFGLPCPPRRLAPRHHPDEVVRKIGGYAKKYR